MATAVPVQAWPGAGPRRAGPAPACPGLPPRLGSPPLGPARSVPAGLGPTAGDRAGLGRSLGLPWGWAPGWVGGIWEPFGTPTPTVPLPVPREDPRLTMYCIKRCKNKISPVQSRASPSGVRRSIPLSPQRLPGPERNWPNLRPSRD